MTERLYFHHMVGTGGNIFAVAIADSEPGYKRVQLTAGLGGYSAGDTLPLIEGNERTLFYGHNLLGLVEKAGIDGRYFTLLRNPLDRLITDFFWNVGHQQGMSAHKAMGLFTEFVNSNDHLEFYIHHCGPLNFNNAQHFRADECSTVSNAQADVMARERLERCFWLVGITELFEQSLFLVAEAVGITKVHHWWKRSQPKTRFRPQFMDFPKSLRNQIERKTAFNMALYGFYRSKFESKFKVEQFGDSFVNHFNEAHPCSMR